MELLNIKLNVQKLYNRLMAIILALSLINIPVINVQGATTSTYTLTNSSGNAVIKFSCSNTITDIDFDGTYMEFSEIGSYPKYLSYVEESGEVKIKNNTTDYSYSLTRSGNNYTLTIKGKANQYPNIKGVSTKFSRETIDNNEVIRATFVYDQPILNVYYSGGDTKYYIDSGSITDLLLMSGSSNMSTINSTTSTTNNTTTVIKDISLSTAISTYNSNNTIKFSGSSITKTVTIPANLLNQTSGTYKILNIKEGETVTYNPSSVDTFDSSYGDDKPAISKIGLTSGKYNDEYTITKSDSTYLIKKNSYCIMTVNTSGDDIKIKSLATSQTVNYVELSYYYKDLQGSSVNIPCTPGTILLDVEMQNTAPKMYSNDFTSDYELCAGQINYFNAKNLIKYTNANDKTVYAVTDREQSIDELTITNVTCKEGFDTDLQGGIVTVDLRDLDNNDNSRFIDFIVTVSDGSLSATTTVSLKVTKSYIIPTLDTSETNAVTLDISSTNISNEKYLLIGTTDSSAANYEEYKITVDSIKLNGYQSLSPKIASAEVLGYENNESGALCARVKFSLNNMDNLETSENTYFQVVLKTTTASGLTAESYLNIIPAMTDIENAKEGLLYVHRRPQARFKVNVTRNSGKITAIKVSDTNLSYDPDFTEGTNSVENGIYAVRWDINVVGTTYHWTNWGTNNTDNTREKYSTVSKGEVDTHNGTKGNTTQLMTDLEGSVNSQFINWINSGYLNNGSSGQRSVTITLKVQDRCNDGWKDGVWSDPYTIVIDGSNNLPPVALFTINQPSFTMPYNSDTYDIQVTDKSYDMDSTVLKNWHWSLYDCDGEQVGSSIDLTSSNTTKLTNDDATSFKKLALNKAYAIQNTAGTTKTTVFKIGLIVTDGDGATSDEYFQEFQLFKDNDAPSFNTTDERVYLKDPGYDLVTGDNYGTATTNGIINTTLTSVADDYHTSTGGLYGNYTYEGQKVDNTAKWNKVAPMMQTVNQSLRVTSSPFSKPFGDKTVTELGFLPGVFKVTTQVSDIATGPLMPNGDASKTTEHTSWLRVVPYINFWLTYESGGYVNCNWRKSDNKTIAELGIEVDDILPAAGGSVELVAYTNEYVDSLVVYADYNKDGVKDNDTPVATLTKTGNTVQTSLPWLTHSGTSVETVYEWTGTAVLPEEGIENTTTGLEEINFVGIASSKWEGLGESDTSVQRSKTRTITALMEAVKLFDFNITAVTDRKLSSAFKSYLGSNSGVFVKDLAVDENSYTSSYTNQNIRKGYAFEFNLKSKGLKDDNSKVVVYPHFYTTTGTELKGWVPDENGKYTVFNRYYTSGNTMAGLDDEDTVVDRYPVQYDNTTIGNISELNNLKKTVYSTEQKWEGRYGIPAGTKFTTTDKLNTESTYTGTVLIAFDIRALKNNKEKYNYVGKKQWLKERNGSPSNKSKYVTLEQNWLSANKTLGAVIVYDYQGKSALDDYTSDPVWKE